MKPGGCHAARLLRHLSEFELVGEDVIRRSNQNNMSLLKPGKGGYVTVCVGPRKSCFYVLLHRLKFALAYGWLPETVDHVDGDKKNNLLANLRPASKCQQTLNRRQVRSRAALPRGVTFKPSGRFRAKAYSGKSQIYLGTYDSPFEASEAVEEFLRQTHGEFYKPQTGGSLAAKNT